MTPQERYIKAAHAVQSGVAMDMETDPGNSAGATAPKHLRVGLNNVMCDHSSLAKLLVGKGIITEAEYFEAIVTGTEAEAKRYEKILSDRLGTKVTLA
jgi:hypothetical protein